MKNKKDTLIQDLDYVMESMKTQYGLHNEGAGAENIFSELKLKLPKISMGENNIINTSMYAEAMVIKGMKANGYAYKKPIGDKLHFFNAQTSVSIYYNQKLKHITLVP